MIHAGTIIENPITKSKVIVLKTEVETGGTGWFLEHHNPPHATPDIAEHLHLAWTETFEIVSGTAHYKLNGVKGIAKAGEKIVMPPKQPHIHPWNAGETELIYTQLDTFDQPNPSAVQEVLGVFATIAGLAREGKVDRRGQPKNPLQLMATLKLLSKHGGYDASAPIPVQNFLAATLGTLAEALGYKGSDPRYLSTNLQ